jgi:hypothetical protein
VNPRIRRRALRNFVASLLLSEMSVAEMRQLADDLSNGNLASELGERIRYAAELLAIDNLKRDLRRNKDHPEPNEAPASPEDHLVQAALNAISRQRLTKKAIWELMRTASPGFDPGHISSDVTIKEHVSKYFESASDSDRARFLNLIKGETTDAYLKGISKPR